MVVNKVADVVMWSVRLADAMASIVASIEITLSTGIMANKRANGCCEHCVKGLLRTGRLV